jgi:hypothetical protein
MISKKVLSHRFSGEPQEVCGSAAQKHTKKPEITLGLFLYNNGSRY